MSDHAGDRPPQAECWPTWHQARRKDAIAALGAMGIVAVAGDRQLALPKSRNQNHAWH
jgi:hypothetical protein